LSSDEVAGGEMVKRDGDLNHSLIEGLGPAMNPPPDLFEDVVGSEIAALVDEVDAVLEFGGQGDIVTYCRGRDALETAGRMPALRMRAGCLRYKCRPAAGAMKPGRCRELRWLD